MTLTPKQEKFAQAVASGMTQADAYRHAYNAENMADSTIWSRASELAADGKVSGRIKALQEAATIAALWSRELSIKTKRQALQLAMEKKDSRAIIQAGDALDRLYGYEPPKRVDVTSSDGSMSPNKRRPFEDLTDEELDEELARRGLKRADIGL
jgi:phage terminase small subunit